MHSTLPLPRSLVTLPSSVSLDASFRQTPNELVPLGHRHSEGTTPIQELRLGLLPTLQGRMNWPEVGWRSREWAKPGVQMLEVELAGLCSSNIIPSRQPPFLQRPLFSGFDQFYLNPQMLFSFSQLLSECFRCVLLFNNAV